MLLFLCVVCVDPSPHLYSHLCDTGTVEYLITHMVIMHISHNAWLLAITVVGLVRYGFVMHIA